MFHIEKKRRTILVGLSRKQPKRAKGILRQTGAEDISSTGEAKGQEVIATPPAKPLAPVVDMMDALKRSLAAREGASRRQPRAASAISGGTVTRTTKTRKKAS